MANSTDGSPWDEPVPENIVPKKSQPTVIGDLNAGNKSTAPATPATNQAASASQPLNVPKNIKEPVGEKIDAASVAPATAPASPAPAEPKSIPVATENQSAVSPTSVAEPPAGDISHLYQPVPAASQPPATAANETQKPAQVPLHPAPTPPAPPSGQRPGGRNPKVIILAVIAGFIILTAGSIFLTEAGMISIGLEKAYGTIRLETLWGGLPANPEQAFAISAAKMKSEDNFKASGSATMTVNKSVQSNIFSPIVSATALPVLAISGDQPVSGIKALLAAVEEDLDSVTEADNPESTSGSLATPSSTPTTTIVSNQEVVANISAKINSAVSGAIIDLKSSKNPNGQVELVYSKDKLYLKSSGNIVYNSTAGAGWASYDMTKNNLSSPSGSFWGSSFSGSDFSMTGTRLGSEKIGGVRCYHYSGVANIGGSLETFGLSDSSVSNLDFEFWSGIADHRIYQIKMKVIPNAKAAISRLDLQLNFSDFGNDTGNYSVPATSTPSTGNKPNLATAEARDSQRKSDLTSIAKALDDYRLAYNTYPPATKTEKIAAGSGTLFESLIPTFISVLPIDPSGPTYYYGYESDGTKYTLSAVLEVKTDKQGKVAGDKNIYFLRSQ